MRSVCHTRLAPTPSVEISVARQSPRHVACSSLTSTSIPGPVPRHPSGTAGYGASRSPGYRPSTARSTSVPVIQSSMTSGADSLPAVVVHGGRRGLAQGGSYPALTLSGLVAMLPEVITRLTVDSSASSVAGGLEILGQVMEWQLRAVGQAQGLSQVDDPAQSRHCLSHCDRSVTGHHHALHRERPTRQRPGNSAGSAWPQN